MIILVKENKDAAVKSKVSIQFGHFPKAYWKYLSVIALFSIGNSSNSFLILQIKNKGLSLVDTVLV